MHEGECGCGPAGADAKGQMAEPKKCEWCRTPLGGGHARACCTWFCAEVFLVLGLVALIAAWVTNYQGTTWLGFESDYLFHDAIVFLIRSLMAKMKMRSYKMKLMMGDGCGEGGGCGSGSCGGESCGCK